MLLALIAGFTALKFQKASIALLTLVVIGYQGIGTVAAWIISGNIITACHELTIGIPGMLFQIIGGWLLINHVIRK